MINKTTIAVLNNNETQIVAGGSRWTDFRDSIAGPVEKGYKKVEKVVQGGRDKVVEFLNPEPEVIIKTVTECPDLNKLFGPDWQTLIIAYKNGTTRSVSNP